MPDYPLSYSLKSRSCECLSYTDAPAHTGPKHFDTFIIIQSCKSDKPSIIIIINHNHNVVLITQAGEGVSSLFLLLQPNSFPLYPPPPPPSSLLPSPPPFSPCCYLLSPLPTPHLLPSPPASLYLSSPFRLCCLPSPASSLPLLLSPFYSPPPCPMPTASKQIPVNCYSVNLGLTQPHDYIWCDNQLSGALTSDNPV